MRTETLHIRVSPDEKRALDAAAAAARMPLARYLHRLVTMNLALDSELAAIRQAVESRPAGGPESESVDIRREIKSAVAAGLADMRKSVESAAAERVRDIVITLNHLRQENRDTQGTLEALRRAISQTGISLPDDEPEENAALLELLFLFRAISKRERVVNAQAELALLGIEPAHGDIAVAPKPAAEPEPVPEPEKKRKFGIF